MKKKIKVYIAAPYRIADPCVNTNRAMLVWYQLWKRGFYPYCPHWSHFQHTFTPLTLMSWIEYDLLWLEACDAVLRLDGESSGADGEEAHAHGLGKPVFHTIDDLVLWKRAQDANETN